MTRCPRKGWGLLALLLTAACAARTAPTTATRPTSRELMVLVPDPDTGAVGQASVTTPHGTVTLAGAGAGTSVVTDAAPTPPVTYSDADIARLFGDTPAAIAPPARRFLLYFDSASSTPNGDAQANLRTIVDVVRARAAAEIAIIGHTDTVGPAQANIDVGRRRAEAVRDLFVGLGLDAATILVTSHGESNQLIPTADDTEEARNRRVEVTVR